MAVCNNGINCQCHACTFRASCRFCGTLHVNRGFMHEHEKTHLTEVLK